MAVPEVADFAKANRILNEPYNDPTLLLLSTGDQYIPPALLDQIPRQLCKVAPKVNYKVVAGVDHSGTINATLRDQLAWMADRFAGRPVSPGCSALN